MPVFCSPMLMFAPSGKYVYERNREFVFDQSLMTTHSLVCPRFPGSTSRRCTLDMGQLHYSDKGQAARTIIKLLIKLSLEMMNAFSNECRIICSKRSFGGWAWG